MKDKSEISAIGHRVVQGAEFFTKSEIVTDAIIDKIEEIAPLAPVLAWPMCRACAAPRPCSAKRCPTLSFSTPPSSRPCPKRRICTACRMRCMKNIPSAATAPMAPATVM